FFVSLTPPAFPRPPAWIWAFTTYTGVSSLAAHFSAAPTLLTSFPFGTVIPNCANNCFAWNSCTFMRVPSNGRGTARRPSALLVMQRRIDQHRILCNIQLIALVLPNHSREMLL